MGDERYSLGFANTKEGQEREEALRLANLKEQEAQAALRKKQNDNNAARAAKEK